MTSPKAPDNNTINARLAVAFSGYKEHPTLPGYFQRPNTENGHVPVRPPAYTDSLALAVELLMRASIEHKLVFSIVSPFYNSNVMLNKEFEVTIHSNTKFMDAKGASEHFSESISLALYAAGVSLGLIKEEQ